MRLGNSPGNRVVVMCCVQFKLYGALVYSVKYGITSPSYCFVTESSFLLAVFNLNYQLGGKSLCNAVQNAENGNTVILYSSKVR